MKFVKVNEGGVSRDDGVSFQIQGPDYLEYRNGECVTLVSIDYDPQTRCTNIYASEVSECIVSNRVEHMSESMKKQLVEDLTEGFSLLKGNFMII